MKMCMIKMYLTKCETSVEQNFEAEVRYSRYIWVLNIMVLDGRKTFQKNITDWEASDWKTINIHIQYMEERVLL